jgi:hypothetical protein
MEGIDFSLGFMIDGPARTFREGKGDHPNAQLPSIFSLHHFDPLLMPLLSLVIRSLMRVNTTTTTLLV